MSVSPIQISLNEDGCESVNELGYFRPLYSQPYRPLSVTCPAVDVTGLPPVLTYDCISGQCTLNPIGTGQFPTLDGCIASGCSPPPPPPTEAGIGGGLALLAGLFFLAMAAKKKE
jgi:hypothetical protein